MITRRNYIENFLLNLTGLQVANLVSATAVFVRYYMKIPTNITLMCGKARVGVPRTP